MQVWCLGDDYYRRFQREPREEDPSEDLLHQGCPEFIRILYGFEPEQNDLQIAKDLTVMGGVYNIPSLQKAAAEALVDHVNMDNLVEMMESVLKCLRIISSAERESWNNIAIVPVIKYIC